MHLGGRTRATDSLARSDYDLLRLVVSFCDFVSIVDDLEADSPGSMILIIGPDLYNFVKLRGRCLLSNLLLFYFTDGSCCVEIEGLN